MEGRMLNANAFWSIAEKAVEVAGAASSEAAAAAAAAAAALDLEDFFFLEEAEVEDVADCLAATA